MIDEGTESGAHLESTPDEEVENAGEDLASGRGRGLLSFVRRLPPRHRATVFIIAVTTIITSALDGIGLALLAQTVEFLIDRDAVESGDSIFNWAESAFDAVGIPFTIGWTTAFVGGIFVIRSFAMLAQSWISATLLTRYEVELRTSGFDAIMRAGWPFFLRQRAGRVSNALTAEVHRAGEAFTALNLAIGSMIGILTYAAISIVVSWQLTLSAMAAIVVFLFAFNLLNRFARQIGEGTTDANADLMSAINEGVSGAKIIKGQALEASTMARFKEFAARRGHFNKRLGVTQGTLMALSELAFFGLLIGVLLFATKLLNLSPSLLALFSLLFIRMFQRARVLQTTLFVANTFLSGAVEVQRVTDQAKATSEPSGGRQFERLERGIDFQNVNFAYDNGEPVLKDVSITVLTGSMVALVGPSGVGKTSILDLTLGLLLPKSGRLLVNGEPLELYDTRSWRSKLAYVSQDPIVLHESIFRNITWGRENASLEEVRVAARIAQADDFITALPDGYDTVIGDRGMRLSGGQRQRITLARAFLREPELLILDEATSELDPEVESRIQDALEQARGGMTILMSAHRLSTIASADKIYVMDGGRVVESGTMEELFEREGTFYRMYKDPDPGSEPGDTI